MDNAEQSSRPPSKGIFDTASLLGPCSWWSAASPIATSAEFPGCGVVPISDPFGRSGICGRSSVSPAHLNVQQPPRRIVEEVLGHLYAKPPSAELKNETQSSGISSPQTLCKTSAIPNLLGVAPKKSSKTKSDKETNHSKISDKNKSTCNNIYTSISGVTSVSGNKLAKSSKKSIETVSDILGRSAVSPEKVVKRKSKPKVSKPDAARNGKKFKSDKKKSKQSKEKKVKKSSSESESHMDSSSSSSEADSSGMVSSSSSESSDEEEREKQQKELARLKKQQQELRRKVQELTQATHDSTQQKPEAHAKKVSGTPKNSLPSSVTLNHPLKQVPTPAHSSPVLPVHSKPIPTEISAGACDNVTDEEQNLSFPLDLCMKKQEPTFEVTTSMTSSFIPSTTTTTAKKKQFLTTDSNVTGANKMAAPKKRGRKPKAIQMTAATPPVQPEKVRKIKRNSIKDISSLLMPTKMDLTPVHPPNPSLLKTVNSNPCSKVPVSNTLGNSNDILPHPKKNFTLDHLLSETNGNLDMLPQFQENDGSFYSGASFVSKNAKIKEKKKNNNKVKKAEEKIKEPESSPQPDSRPESSSSSESDPDDETDSDDTEHSHSESSTSASTERRRKRSYDEDGDDYQNKKRRSLPDQREVLIPLEHGWRRETRIKSFSRSGVRGEVIYYAPCGKKLRSYPEVVRYLIKNGITDLGRENFTFSTKMNVGDFLEKSSSGSGQDYVLLSEQEVVARIEEARSAKSRLGVQNRKPNIPKPSEEEEQQRQWEQKQIQHHLEQQAKSRMALETKLLKQAQREQALVAAREEKRLRAEESRKQKEQQRMMKQQEKFERLEQMRIEREIRAQQLLEEQEMKRQQAVFLREQERERRRQHMILVRALENRKKQEERERKREEILFEKRINREKKLEQRRMELDYLRELKKPVDDMMLKNLIELPTLNRIPGVKLCGKPFADILMVFEFLHNFGETLGFDVESLPTLNTLQNALLNVDEKCEEELLSVVHHLLVCVIDDPGVPHNPEAQTVLGQHLKDADITNSNVSEILRLYFIALDKKCPMMEWLQLKPFLSLNPSQKAEIIAFLCDELLTSRLLMRQIDNNIDNVNTLRKDKWLVEGDLRRYRSIQQRRALKARLSAMEENKDNPNLANMLSADLPDFSLVKENQSGLEDDSKEKTDKEKLDDMESELANESGNESDETQAPGQISDNEEDDLHLSNDEINKKIDKLSKQLNQCSNRLTKSFYTIRGVTFGMDRFHRRYWVLPKAGGVFVESMESCLKDSERELVLAFTKKTESSDENSKDKQTPQERKEKETKSSADDQTKAKEPDAMECSDEKTEVKCDSDLTIEGNKSEEKENELSKSEIDSTKLDFGAVDIKKENNKDDSNKSNEVVVKADRSKTTEEDIGKDTSDKVVKDALNMDVNDAPVNTMKDILEKTAKDSSSKIVKDISDSICKDKETVEKDNSDLKSENKESELKTISVDAKFNESKSNSSENDKEAKNLTQTPQKIWTIDTKSNEPNIQNIKKEPDIKIKKEDKKDSKNKESDNKFIEKMLSVKDEKKPNVNIFMPNLCDNNMNLDLGAKLLNNSDRHNTPNPSIPPDQNWVLHSPLFASILAGNMLFNGPLMSQRDMNGTYFNLPKNDSNNPFGPFLGLQPNALSEQIFKSFGEKSNSQKPWFSILPRMPCDESLISPPQPSRNSSNHSSHSSDVRSSRVAHPTQSPNAAPGHVASALSNLQMELMNGVPPGFFLHPFLPPQYGPAYQSTPTTSSQHSSFTSSMSHSSPMPDFGLNFNRPPAASTPNSIPTPSATPGPTSHGYATPTSRDSPSPSFAKRLMMEKMTQEYEAPLPISSELQRGWWRITDTNQLKQIISALHHRGIREKMFQKQLQKHFTFACTSCSQGQNQDTELQITELDEEISKKVGGAPDPDPPDFWYRDIALRTDMAILEQVENLEEKVDGSSMQVKFWKPPPKLSVEPLSKFIPACEQYIHYKADELYDAIRERIFLRNSKKGSSKKKKPPKKELELEQQMDVDIDKKPDDELNESFAESEIPDVSETTIEDLEKSIVEEEKVESDIIPLPPGKLNPVEEAQKRLLKVEAAIERRYLKPPLAINANDLSKSTLSNNGVSSTQSTSDLPEEECLPPGLIKWRNAVENCRTAAQLAMCLNFLETHTAWDKSIMRASCQFCHSGDNEEKLLLCDGCDKGYHTYCFKPVMETIPEGDWYCFECLNKATGDNVCVICGTKGKLIECETCPKTFHLSCLEPPLSKMPKAKWYCSGCNLTRPKKKKSSKKDKEKEKESTEETKEVVEKPAKKSEEKPPSKAKTSEKKEKKEKQPQNPGNKDLVPCSQIIEEMEQHEDAWPFLMPVNTKQFPTYRKVIKKPMDIATMRTKLENGQYKCREDFANDARLIFDNCETFNEDDSPVGQAGHSMRAYFETRWSELCNT